MRLRELLDTLFPVREWQELRAYSGGRCTCCGYPKVLTLDRAPGGPVRGLVCSDCRDGLAQIDAGEVQPEGLYAEYLASPWRSAG